MRLVGGANAVWGAFDCHAPILVSQFRNRSDLGHTIVDFGKFVEFDVNTQMNWIEAIRRVARVFAAAALLCVIAGVFASFYVAGTQGLRSDFYVWALAGGFMGIVLWIAGWVIEGLAKPR